jgi:hypothetical protein
LIGSVTGIIGVDTVDLGAHDDGTPRWIASVRSIPGCPSLTRLRTSTGRVLSAPAAEAKGTTDRNASTDSNATIGSGSAVESPSVDLPVLMASTLEGVS